MLKRTILFGAMAATVIASIVAILAALDVITVADLRTTLGRSLLVVGIATTALLLLIALGKAVLPVHGEPPAKH
jgi:hypothetical protein